MRNNQNDYSAVYRNTGTAKRCLNRVEDHYSIHTYKTEWQDAKDFFTGLLTVLLFIVLIGFIVLPFINF